MKSPLRRFRGFSLHKHADAKDRRDLRPLPQLDELALASQDMQDMRDCYDSLLSAAAATTNSAYEFSESLQELGACLLEKTALNDNEESGKVLLMLGKSQFELQKLVDSYRYHIFQTITTPSESLLNELRTVEEMKRQCDEKRNVYEYMMMRQREKGRSKSGKAETFSVQQLQTAHEEYDNEATLFVFRLKSLKQGQSRSLLTQAARHHAAQLSFFKKALKCLEAIEPHVKMVTEEQHIDYQFSGLEDDGDEDDYGSDTHGNGELSFDYGQNDREEDVASVSPSQNSMELDEADITFPQVTTKETPKEIVDRSCRKSLSFSRDIRTGSQSAPLFAVNKSDPADKMKYMPSSTRKFNTYVLPTPVITKSSNSTESGNPLPVPRTLTTSLSGRSRNGWHSSPLDAKKFDRSLGNEKASRPTVQSIYRQSKNCTTSTQLPIPLADGLLFSQLDPLGASDSKKIKRQSFSGPLTSKPWPTKPVSKEPPLLFSGPILRMVQPAASPPKISPSASPTFTSSLKISELHELPRPPASSALKSSRPMGLVGHSAPLVPKSQIPSATNTSVMSNAASPLPTPPQAIARSFSIPSRKMTSLDVSKPLDAGHNIEMASPPLTPMILPNKLPSSTGSETVVQAV